MLPTAFRGYQKHAKVANAMPKMAHDPSPSDPRSFFPRFFRGTILLAALVFLTTCGYRFTGSDGPPRGIEKLYIQLIENRTTEPGIDVVFTNALKNEFILKYQGILSDREQAKAILSGAIVGIRTKTVSRRGALTSLERQLLMTVDLTLKSTDSDGLWFAKGVSSSDTYSVISGDKEANEQNKREALQKLAEKIAGISFNRLSDDF